jgi:hypothetical protein
VSGLDFQKRNALNTQQELTFPPIPSGRTAMPRDLFVVMSVAAFYGAPSTRSKMALSIVPGFQMCGQLLNRWHLTLAGSG